MAVGCISCMRGGRRRGSIDPTYGRMCSCLRSDGVPALCPCSSARMLLWMQILSAARAAYTKGNTGNNRSWETGLRSAGHYLAPIGDPSRGLFGSIRGPDAASARLQHIRRSGGPFQAKRNESRGLSVSASEPSLRAHTRSAPTCFGDSMRAELASMAESTAEPTVEPTAESMAESVS
eukprot:3574579-Pleurochrysis_carterae.AAC.1